MPNAKTAYVEKLFHRRPESAVSRALALIAKRARVMENDVLVYFGGMPSQFISKLLVDMPCVDEQHIGQLDVDLSNIRLAKDEFGWTRQPGELVDLWKALQIVAHQLVRLRIQKRGS